MACTGFFALQKSAEPLDEPTRTTRSESDRARGDALARHTEARFERRAHSSQFTLARGERIRRFLA